MFIIRYHCDICACDCTDLIRIKCAECSEYDLCVQCFSRGKSSGTHKPYHDYHIIEQHSYPIFSDDWGADEELLLIGGAETYGLGNWQCIAEHIGGRSKEEVGKHYFDIYVNSDQYPLPEMNKDFSTITVDDFNMRKKQRLNKRKRAPLLNPKTKQTASVPSCHEVQGYMPGRLDFETEYDNEAETFVKDMIFEPDETEQDIDLKLTVLEIYNQSLTTRSERKRIILNHKLLDYRKNISLEKKRTRDEKDLFNKLKPFARLMTKEDFESFTNDMIIEYQCRKRISELQEYRRNGIESLQVSQQYEKDKSSRLQMFSRYSNGIGSNSLSALSNSRHTANSMGMSKEPRSSSINNFRNSPIPISKNHTNSSGSLLKNKYNRKLPSNPLDISDSADIELLSLEEQELCSQLRLLPKPYLAIKETLFRELLRTGGILRKRTARELIKIDVNKTARIYEFFQEQRWLIVP